MCAICGIYNFNHKEPVSNDLIKKMCDVVAHRGPDDSGTFLDGNIGLGNRRLSIIDLQKGHQPMTNEDGSIWVVYNGEIYNHPELRDSLKKKHVFLTDCDTETLVHLYEEFEDAMVNRLRGMFSFALYDKRKQKLLLVRDRFGMKPLYYCLTEKGVTFGSEIKSILQDPRIAREVNMEAMSDYLTFNYVPGPETLFRGIKKLPPAHLMVCENGKASVRRYWNLDYDSEKREGDAYYFERTLELLKEAVKIHLMSDVPLGAFLSGGIDSSAIVALMSELSPGRVKTFSIGFEGPSFFNELEEASLVARHFKTEHHPLRVGPKDILEVLPKLVWAFDEPFGDIVALPTFLVSKFAREYVKVVLTGDGSDEIFAGYLRYAVDRFARHYLKLPSFFRNVAKASASQLPRLKRFKKALHGLSNETVSVRYAWWLAQMNDSTKGKLFSSQLSKENASRNSSFNIFEPLFSETEEVDPLNRLLYADLRNWLGDVHLTRVDRMSMANSLEARVPFLDHKLVEFAATIPTDLKLKGFTGKYILKKIMKGILPTPILKKKKHGFTVPISYWFRNELKDFAWSILTDPVTQKRPYFDHRFVRSILESHDRGREEMSTTIWALLNLEFWHRMFIDRVPEKDTVTS